MKYRERFSLKGLIVWFVCAVFFLYEFLLRTVVGTFQFPLMSELKLSNFQFSIISSTAYLLIYTIMQIPVGFIVERIGLRSSLFFACIACGISSVGFSFSHTYWLALLFRFFIGLGSSFGFICLLVAVYDWMPRRHITFMIGVSQFVGVMGPILAAGPLESLVGSSAVSWRDVFGVLGIIGFFLSSLIFFFVCNYHSKVGQFIILKRPQPVRSTIATLFSGTQPWFIAIFGALVYFSLEYLSENEGKSFLMLKGYTSAFAAYMITLAWVGYAIGCPLLGFLSDRFSRRLPVMRFSAISCIIGIIGVVFIYDRFLLMISFFLLGFGASGQSVGFAIMTEQFNKNYRALALSLNNTVITLCSALNAPLLAMLIDHSHEGGGAIQFQDYIPTFSLLVGIVSFSIIFPLFFIKETFCKSAVSFTFLRD